jgi:hypothetical protein
LGYIFSSAKKERKTPHNSKQKQCPASCIFKSRRTFVHLAYGRVARAPACGSLCGILGRHMFNKLKKIILKLFHVDPIVMPGPFYFKISLDIRTFIILRKTLPTKAFGPLLVIIVQKIVRIHGIRLDNVL